MLPSLKRQAAPRALPEVSKGVPDLRDVRPPVEYLRDLPVSNALAARLLTMNPTRVSTLLSKQRAEGRVKGRMWEGRWSLTVGDLPQTARCLWAELAYQPEALEGSLNKLLTVGMACEVLGLPTRGKRNLAELLRRQYRFRDELVFRERLQYPLWGAPLRYRDELHEAWLSRRGNRSWIAACMAKAEG